MDTVIDMHHKSCSDANISLVFVQGHALIHFACFIMTWTIKPLNDPMVCFEYDSSASNYDYFFVQDKIISSIANQLPWVHLASGILLFLAELIDSCTLYAHYTEMMRVLTIPMYIYVIL
jgi:hypothetical protein